MKKKYWILGMVLMLAVLLIPVPFGVYKDGGTRVYRSLTYTIVDWNRIVSADTLYSKLRLYVLPRAYDSIDGLWEWEMTQVELPQKAEEREFMAVIREIHGDSGVTVEPLEGSWERNSADRISFGIENLQALPLYVGCLVSVKYDGQIMETYPAQIRPSSWELAGDFRRESVGELWQEYPFEEYMLDPYTVVGWITEIYADAFVLTVEQPEARSAALIRGTLEPQWSLGDHVAVTFKYVKISWEKGLFRGELVQVKEPSSEIEIIDTSPFTAEDIEEVTFAKPVIYLYPQQETKVDVQLDLQGDFLCTYPSYEDGWTVTAQPDGTLTDEAGKTYNYLYWEGTAMPTADLTQGFCIPGENTAEFLETALEQLGLTRREANEFIVYWLPLMEDNAYNLISFDTEAYEQSAKLYITPEPDTLIRVFMTWKPSEEFVDLPAQELTASERTGFVAVEWGGTVVE